MRPDAASAASLIFRSVSGEARSGSGTGEAAFRYAIEDGIGVFYWVDEECAYALSGKLDRSQLLAVARVVYGQITAAEVSGRH